MKCVLATLGSRGNTEPCAAIGRELLRRGHDVLMAVPPDGDRLTSAGGDEHDADVAGGRGRPGAHRREFRAARSRLDRLAVQRGTYPTLLRCDNRLELACNATDGRLSFAVDLCPAF